MAQQRPESKSELATTPPSQDVPHSEPAGLLTLIKDMLDELTALRVTAQNQQMDRGAGATEKPIFYRIVRCRETIDLVGLMADYFEVIEPGANRNKGAHRVFCKSIRHRPDGIEVTFESAQRIMGLSSVDGCFVPWVAIAGALRMDSSKPRRDPQAAIPDVEQLRAPPDVPAFQNASGAQPTSGRDPRLSPRPRFPVAPPPEPEEPEPEE